MPVEPNKSVFLSNLHYFYAQTDGTYRWPEGVVGDLLKQAKKEIEASLAADKAEIEKAFNGGRMSKPASEIELMHLRHLWSQDPSRQHICPNCLARREGKVTDGEHSSWCARKREVAAMERNAAKYEAAI